MDDGVLGSSSGSDERLSSSLLELARNGDQDALDTLVARYRPRLVRWASGRLPRWARDIADTQDLVQETLFQTFRRIERFETRGDGALLAYLRHATLNRIREELRRVKRRPQKVDLDSQAEHDAWSPLEHAIGGEAVDRYERALAELRAEDREVIVARVEFGYTNGEIAELLKKPSANAARMALERALVRLAKRMAGTAT
jgi:RNA polymerase sigma-70 factor (ECF subfamily)